MFFMKGQMRITFKIHITFNNMTKQWHSKKTDRQNDSGLQAYLGRVTFSEATPNKQ